jgi:uncharacterized membrane protein
MSLLSHQRADTVDRRSTARSALIFALVALVSTVLVWPMLLTTSGFGGDWEHHLWYVWHQSLAIRADGVPSLFLNTHYSALYPQYAFYGGTIFAITGTLGVILGDSPLSAYILSYILGFMAAYGGWYWTARILGLGCWLAQVPGLLFVTSACYLTVVYAQGDWPEFLAVSMLPLMLAAALSVVRTERPRLLPAIALVASSVVFFGSHILTVLWASTFLAIGCVALVLLVPEARRRLPPRRLLRIAALVTPALLVDAWFLLPMIVYSSNTRIGSENGYIAANADLHETMHLVAFHHLFTLSRAATARGHPDFAIPLPTLTILWLLASIVLVLVLIRRGAWVRVLVIVATITVGIVALMTHAGLLLSLPRPYRLLQFSYRLEGYVLMGVSAAVLVVLLLVVRSGSQRLRRWSWTIVPIVILSAVGALQQLSAYPRTPLIRAATFAPGSEVFSEKYDDYAYVPLPFISEAQLPEVEIPPAAIHDNRVSLTLHVRPGQLVATNIGGGPNLVHVTGASIAGADGRSQLVLAVDASASGGSVDPHTPIVSERISISPAQSTPVVLGLWLTLAGAAILLAELAVFLVRRHRRREDPRPGSSSGGSSSPRTRERELQVEPVDAGLL